MVRLLTDKQLHAQDTHQQNKNTHTYTGIAITCNAWISILKFGSRTSPSMKSINSGSRALIAVASLWLLTICCNSSIAKARTLQLRASCRSTINRPGTNPKCLSASWLAVRFMCSESTPLVPTVTVPAICSATVRPSSGGDADLPHAAEYSDCISAGSCMRITWNASGARWRTALSACVAVLTTSVLLSRRRSITVGTTSSCRTTASATAFL